MEFNIVCINEEAALQELNWGPLAPEARTIPLDQMLLDMHFKRFIQFKTCLYE